MSISWVVKIGGSLWASPVLPNWLRALARSRVIIVPGGGPFADLVRRSQDVWGFDDRVAHDLAITAMAQYGRMLQGLCQALPTVREWWRLPRALDSGDSVVWIPDPETLDDAAIHPSWDITSDSLAAWLAGQVGAEQLLLIKSVAVPEGEAGLARLIQSGILDRAFADMIHGRGSPVWICGPERHDRCRPGLRNPGNSFTRVMTAPPYA